MDNFIDRLAQRLVSQESMQANLDADAMEAEAMKEQAAMLKEQGQALKEQNEALRKQSEAMREQSESMREQSESMRGQSEALREQMETLAKQLGEYQEISKTMRHIQLKNVELGEKVNQLCDFSLQKLEEAEAAASQEEEQESEDVALQELMHTYQDQMENHVHRENVKVYKNVQAVVEEQTSKVLEETVKRLKSQTQELQASVAQLQLENKKSHRVNTILIGITLALSLIGVVFQILEQFGVIDYLTGMAGM
ncbi:MAG: hypothetical protein LUE87_09540 [Lachnospiraceae bacterium]|nr:hypothetical protein [Lachnospiraceae bacterium]